MSKFYTNNVGAEIASNIKMAEKIHNHVFVDNLTDAQLDDLDHQVSLNKKSKIIEYVKARCKIVAKQKVADAIERLTNDGTYLHEHTIIKLVIY